jgi:large subunit ribosomal protein L25
MRELEVRCLPTEIPDKFTVDIAALKIGDSIHVSQLPIPAGVELLSGLEEIVVTISAPTKDEEPVAAAVPAEGEAVAAVPGAEGGAAAPAAGAKGAAPAAGAKGAAPAAGAKGAAPEAKGADAGKKGADKKPEGKK